MDRTKKIKVVINKEPWECGVWVDDKILTCRKISINAEVNEPVSLTLEIPLIAFDDVQIETCEFVAKGD